MEIGAERQPPSFEQQFKSRVELYSEEGGISLVDIVPPGELADKVPVLIAPGWSEDPDTYKKTLMTGFKEGRRVIALGHLPAGKTTEILSGEENQEESRKALLLLSLLTEKRIEKVDVIAHSEGAVNTLIAALASPKQFRNIVLDMPAGLIGKDKKYLLVGRFWKLVISEAFTRGLFKRDDPTNSLSTLLRVSKYILQNSRRTNKEVEALSSANIVEMIKELSNQGVKISVIAGVNDPLFPVSRQIANMRKFSDNLPVRGYYSVIGGHNELSIKPDQHAVLAFNALENLRDLPTESP